MEFASSQMGETADAGIPTEVVKDTKEVEGADDVDIEDSGWR